MTGRFNHVRPFSKVHRLEQRATLVGIQITNLHDIPGLRNIVIWRNGDISNRNNCNTLDDIMAVSGVIQPNLDATLGIGPNYQA